MLNWIEAQTAAPSISGDGAVVQDGGLRTGIVKVKDLLSSNNLRIPEYQRPYKWTARHVNQLVDDILFFKDKPAYRLGTIVFCEPPGSGDWDIVDGQQRTITLALLAKALFENKSSENLISTLFSDDARNSMKAMIGNLKLSGGISLRNVVENYRELRRRLVDFDEKAIAFLFQRCELVAVGLSDISEAFQFFDSQNARGKDLDPHDLLKAFHLREMSESSTEKERIRAVDKWEKYESDKLVELFSLYLYRIRNWAKGKEARHFDKADIDVFKGVSLQNVQGFPFSDIHRIAHFFTDQYNADYVRQIDRKHMPYPFQLDQVMVNGRRFFEFVDYYKEKLITLQGWLLTGSMPELNKGSVKILDVLNNYDDRHRTGDSYVRKLFECALLFFTDKFGFTDINRAIEKFFLWAYRVRLEYRNVQLATVDNYAIGQSRNKQNIAMFRLIHQAVHPAEVLNVRLDDVDSNQSSGTDTIMDLFKEMGYAKQ